MAGPSVTNTFVNGNVADASQVNQNFTDLVNGATDGTKDYNINALTAAGTATLNGTVILGNAASDTIAANGYVSTNLTIKSTDAGASAGPDIIIDRDSASAADSDAIGRIIFRGNDDAGTPADNDYASIEATVVDSGAGSEDGKLELKVCVAGTNTSYITAEPTKGVSLIGRTDGSSISAGIVGQKIAFTLRTASSGSGSWGSATSSMGQLTAGVYLVIMIGTPVSTGTANHYRWQIRNKSGGSGSGDGLVVAGVSYSAIAAASNDAIIHAVGYYICNSTVDLYGYAYGEDAIANIEISGFAVRIQ